MFGQYLEGERSIRPMSMLEDIWGEPSRLAHADPQLTENNLVLIAIQRVPRGLRSPDPH